MADPQTITVVMPAWQRWALRLVPWVCLAFFALVAWASGPLWHGSRLALMPMIIIFLLLTVWATATVLWFERRVIGECEYDGRTIRFQTIGQPAEQAHALEELSEIGEWLGQQGRGSLGQMLGYRLSFRDGRQVLLSVGVARAKELARRLEANRWPDHPGTL